MPTTAMKLSGLDLFDACTDEERVALPKLIRRFPRMEPAMTEPAWMHRITLRGVETLPVVLR